MAKLHIFLRNMVYPLVFCSLNRIIGFAEGTHARKNLKKYLVFCSLNRIFAAELASGRFIYVILILGLTGFDGEMRWYVSTRRLEGSLHNLSSQKINWQQ